MQFTSMKTISPIQWDKRLSYFRFLTHHRKKVDFKSSIWYCYPLLEIDKFSRKSFTILTHFDGIIIKTKQKNYRKHGIDLEHFHFFIKFITRYQIYKNFLNEWKNFNKSLLWYNFTNTMIARIIHTNRVYSWWQRGDTKNFIWIDRYFHASGFYLVVWHMRFS